MIVKYCKNFMCKLDVEHENHLIVPLRGIILIGIEVLIF